MPEKLYWPLSKLKNWAKNPRSINEKDFKRLKEQIETLGEYKPLIVTEDGTVVGGNMRFRAYKELGWHQAWVSVVEAETDEEKLKYALSDNDRAGNYDEQQLAELISAAPEIDLKLFHVDLGQTVDLSSLLSKFGPDPVEDEAPEVQEEAISKLGEIYQLGRHRVMCGDSIDSDSLTHLMDGKKADMVFTDPPYGVDYVGKTKDALTIQNDKSTNVFKDSLASFILATKKGASFYICCPPGNKFLDFANPFNEVFYLSSILVWSKNTLVMGHSDYQFQHESILYGWLKDSTHKFYGDRRQTSVWQIDKPSRSSDHPTMKPIALVVKAIENSSIEDDIVLDLFLGSGSTLIACEQTNRICYGMEIDPRYVDVIRKRYAKFIDKEDDWEQVTPAVEKQ